jgi:hypothetical protein
LKLHSGDDLPKLLCPACVTILELVENFQVTCSQSIDYIRELIIDNLREEPIEVIVTAEHLEPLMEDKKELSGVADGMYRRPRLVKGVAQEQFQKINNECSGVDGDITPKTEKIIGKIVTTAAFGKVKQKRNSVDAGMYKDIIPKSEMTTFDDIEPLLKAYRKSMKKLENKQLSLAGKPICDLCGKTFVNITSIRNHMKLELLKIQGKRVRITKNVGCSYEGCDHFFKNPERLAKHLKKHEDAKVSCLLLVFEYLSIFKPILSSTSCPLNALIAT